MCNYSTMISTCSNRTLLLIASSAIADCQVQNGPLFLDSTILALTPTRLRQCVIHLRAYAYCPSWRGIARIGRLCHCSSPTICRRASRSLLELCQARTGCKLYVTDSALGACAHVDADASKLSSAYKSRHHSSSPGLLNDRIITLLSLLETVQEPPAIIEGKRPAAHWPSKGEIHIENLAVRYAPHLPYALLGIDVHIEAGQKIGIVGRTGSGKTSE